MLAMTWRLHNGCQVVANRPGANEKREEREMKPSQRSVLISFLVAGALLLPACGGGAEPKCAARPLVHGEQHVGKE